MSELPNRMKVKSNVISAVVWPYSRKQSHSSTSRAAIVKPAQKAAQEAATMDGFGRRISGKGYAERVQRFVVATHAGFAPHQFERAQIASKPTVTPAPGPEEK